MKANIQLRDRAEERLRLTRTQVRQMAANDIVDLVHELQVHQVELEMQNEEMRLLQEQLLQSRQRYSDLYEFAPIGYLTLTCEGLIIDANFLACHWLRRERAEVTAKRFANFVDPAFQDAYFMHFRRVFDTGSRQSCELKLISGERIVHLSSQTHVPEDGYCCTTLTDVTHLVQGTAKQGLIPVAQAISGS